MAMLDADEIVRQYSPTAMIQNAVNSEVMIPCNAQAALKCAYQAGDFKELMKTASFVVVPNWSIEKSVADLQRTDGLDADFRRALTKPLKCPTYPVWKTNLRDYSRAKLGVGECIDVRSMWIVVHAVAAGLCEFEQFGARAGHGNLSAKKVWLETDATNKEIKKAAIFDPLAPNQMVPYAIRASHPNYALDSTRSVRADIWALKMIIVEMLSGQMLSEQPLRNTSIPLINQTWKILLQLVAGFVTEPSQPVVKSALDKLIVLVFSLRERNSDAAPTELNCSQIRDVSANVIQTLDQDGIDAHVVRMFDGWRQFTKKST